MKRLLAFFGRLVGLHFVPDNHVAPVLHLGRYDRVGGPGFFWIIPIIERTLPPIKTSLYVGNFVFSEVLSKDNIPFTMNLTVLFAFDPASALKAAAAQFVRAGEGVLMQVVREFTNRRLRRLVADFNAEQLCGPARLGAIERDLPRYLKNEMRLLGLAPLSAQDGGVMIKEIIAPDTFKRTMLDVKHDEAMLEVLRSYPAPELVHLLNQLIFVNSLKDYSGELALMMGSPETMRMWPWPGSNNGHS